jgi:Inner membrane component domain
VLERRAMISEDGVHGYPHQQPLARHRACEKLRRMRVVLNVIWFMLAGVWMAIGYALAALIMFILIITIRFGVAALRIGIFALWPFGKTVVRRADAGAGSAIGGVLQQFLLTAPRPAPRRIASRIGAAPVTATTRRAETARPAGDRSPSPGPSDEPFG